MPIVIDDGNGLVDRRKMREGMIVTKMTVHRMF